MVIRSSDTDVLITLLGMVGEQRRNHEAVPYGQILMDCGQGNVRRYINILEMCDRIEEWCPGLSTAIVGLHAFTGSDYTAAFYKKRKSESNRYSC